MAYENGQGIVQSYAVVDGECAWKNRKGVRNEARIEARPVDEKHTCYSKEDELHYILPVEHLSRRMA